MDWAIGTINLVCAGVAGGSCKSSSGPLATIAVDVLDAERRLGGSIAADTSECRSPTARATDIPGRAVARALGAAHAARAAAHAAFAGMSWGRRGRSVWFGGIAESARALLGGTALPQTGDQVHVVVQFHSPRAVQLNLFQGLAHNIVWLPLRVLCAFDGRGLVNIALVVDVELAEGVGQAEDLGLGELGVFSRGSCGSVWMDVV